MPGPPGLGGRVDVPQAILCVAEMEMEETGAEIGREDPARLPRRFPLWYDPVREDRPAGHPRDTRSSLCQPQMTPAKDPDDRKMTPRETWYHYLAWFTPEALRKLLRGLPCGWPKHSWRVSPPIPAAERPDPLAQLLRETLACCEEVKMTFDAPSYTVSLFRHGLWH